jgi:hypothetical protein
VHLELEELRAALDPASQSRLLAAEIFIALDHLWVTHALAEGRHRVSALLDAPLALPPSLRARVLRASGGIVIPLGDVELGERRYREALALFEELGDEYNAVGLRAPSPCAGSRRYLLVLAGREVHALNESVGNPMVCPRCCPCWGLAYAKVSGSGARAVRSVVAAARA